ncbi:spondin domain-containing protein [Armatimonas sp.]|uniref:spondin domain-containing protein n=1 Tax=Armatimonas sp. TaxID=1872638 RepID=UPI00286AAD5E|nr:spondin domain-containing protein [Armatimonas sp.]
MFSTRVTRTAISLGILALSGSLSPAIAGTTAVTVTIRNLAPTNSVSFAPLRLGFGNGTFDAFNIGQVAGPEIVSVAEGGSGSAWLPAFAAAEPGAVIGSVGGALFPGMTTSSTFIVDSMSVNNRFFTFANMVIPSNDLFLGNDNPMAFQLFDASGNLLITQIDQTAAQIWDANSEVAIPLNGAFIVGSNNSARVAEGGLVAFDRSELTAFNGLTTGAGYTFSDTALTNSTPIYRISFSASPAPEPGSLLFLAAGAGILALKRRRRAL